MRMKRIALSFFLAPLLFGLIGCNGATPTPIVIGHVSDKTRLDKAGDQTELGIRLALHEVSKDGTLADTFGGRKIEVHHTDARGDLDKFESEAVRLDSVNKCLALFGGFSTQETAALNNARVPLLTFHGQPVSGANSQVFYLGMSPGQQGAVLAKTLVEDAKAKRITILMSDKRPDAVALVDSFQKTLKESEGPAEVMTLCFGADSNWPDLIQRMIRQVPHTVVFAGSVQDFNAWRRMLRKDHADANPQIVYAGADGDHRLFDLEGGDKTSILLATAFYADPANEKITAFRKAYQEAFQTEPDVHAAVAYDGFRILVEAMKRTSPLPTADRLREELMDRLREELLKTKDFEGLTGPLTITPERQVQRTLFVMRLENGTLTVLKTFPVKKVDKEK
jgi:branched-chain amino acid transport system substrate-binding protein